MRPHAESPLGGSDEVRVPVCDSHIVHGRPLAGILDARNGDFLFVFADECVAGGQCVRVHPACAHDPEGVLGSRADDRAAHVQPQHLCVPLEHPFYDLQTGRQFGIVFVAASLCSRRGSAIVLIDYIACSNTDFGVMVIPVSCELTDSNALALSSSISQHSNILNLFSN